MFGQFYRQRPQDSPSGGGIVGRGAVVGVIAALGAAATGVGGLAILATGLAAFDAGVWNDILSNPDLTSSLTNAVDSAINAVLPPDNTDTGQSETGQNPPTGPGPGTDTQGGSGSDGCFVAGTPISTPRGQVPIEQIRLEERIDSFDEGAARFVQNPVARV
ncbi:MAG TPA: hypothetical protein VIF15_19565, partial [Polyangiaceae bacterium]